ncbi:beta/gamma crystallin domain-containing protein [Methylocaldum sp.]|uniref:beta/gamma crystallin domain-containing protein n=1 Tax=Methylocaldum sp. TaxID=1969727 RepID=UPI002D28915A|nr:beta/gamma crystallin domain-containing protein [Methylocaldum sp.]HYE35791.1 beta/gamma crystallin domain-containing protein [Methylocaldum sp.]
MRAWKHLWLGAVAGGLFTVAALSATASEAVPPAVPGTGARPPFAGESSALPTVLIVPGTFSAERVTDGCWVQFYTGDDFTGTQLNIIGPVDMRSMEGPFGARWTGLESAKVGPRARVTVFAGKDFERRSLVLEPGQHIPDLEKSRGRSRLGLFKDIKSLRVICLPYR